MTRSRAAIGTIVVLAKQPLPGRVKTRLTPALTPADAARLAGAALRDTIAAVSATPAHRRLLAFAGDATAWAPAGWVVVDQGDGGLDRRIGTAFAAAGAGSAVLVGMDTPQLTPAHLAAFDPDCFDACLGLAPDGGFWSIGFRDATLAAPLVAGVPMSTERTGEVQLRRLRRAGLRVQLLDELTDVDTVTEAAAVAGAAPHTGFAATWRSVATEVRRTA